MRLSFINRNQAKPLTWKLVQRRQWHRLRKFLGTAGGKNQVLKSLVSLNSDTDEKKENILHLACRKRAPLEIIERLCKIQATLAVETNSQGQTALHISVASLASSSVVDYLLHKNPAATFVQDNESRTPLHIACMCAMGGDYHDDPKLWVAYSPDYETVRLLCHASPHMVNEEEADGKTPIEHSLDSRQLHRKKPCSNIQIYNRIFDTPFSHPVSHPEEAEIYLDDLIRDQNWDAVRDTVHRANSARFKSKSSKLEYNCRCSSALALAVSLDTPSDVIASILRLDPTAASLPDCHGQLPLHIACSAGASVDVVHLLLREDRSEGMFNVALVADNDGRVPLHYAAEYATGSYGDTLEVVAVLCTACPAAASTKDRWGETPGDVASQMEGAAFLDSDMDSDGEMVEAARAVQRILQQIPLMRSRKKESSIGSRAKETSSELQQLRSPSETKLNNFVGQITESELSECAGKDIELDTRFDDFGLNQRESAARKHGEKELHDVVQQNTESKLSECTGKNVALEKHLEEIASFLSSSSQTYSETKLNGAVQQNDASELRKISGEIRLNNIASAARASASQRRSATKRVSSVSRAA